MALDTDDEILQDFLVEAGEILEQLGEQLVDLEQRPDDYDLLNAVFRGFHTIKGGAGFLNIEAMVEICHRAEDVFNILRQGQRRVDAPLMDAVLKVLDIVNEMFESVRGGHEPHHADSGLLAELRRLAQPHQNAENVSKAVAPAAKPAAGSVKAPAAAKSATAKAASKSEKKAPPPSPQPSHSASEVDALLKTATEGLDQAAPGADDEITEDEFESLLDELHGEGKHGGVPPQPKAFAEPETPVAGAKTESADSDEITEEEFDALLDELHGKGKHGGAPPAQETSAAASDDITDAEFDSLLDELHGKGKHGGVPARSVESVEPSAGQKVPASEPPRSAPAPRAARPSRQTPPPVAHEPEPHEEESDEQDASPMAARRAVSGGAPKVAVTAETTVRVDTQRLDEIMNMVGELVLVRNRLATLRATLNDEEVANAVGNLDVVTADLQNAVMKTRMQPIKKVFGRFPRVVRDLARNLKKEVDLEMRGEETDLDKNLVEALADPLIHLVRNAVDHGIETPEERERAGKPRKGHVILSAAQEGDHILLYINDDGKGMDSEVLRRKAVEKGMMDEETAQRLDEKECFNLIFQPGFSTKAVISDVSGRGVGMDVVKTRISQMNGTVEVHSEPGKGSQITIKLPLTLAILPTLMVILGKQPFALPLSSVVEIFNLDLRRTNVVDGRLTIMVRERALPLFYLREWLVAGGHREPGKEGDGHVVVVNVGNVQVGLVVDDLIGQEEVVIKPLGALLQKIGGMAGATITGDGKIALIMDLPGLMRKYAKKG